MESTPPRTLRFNEHSLTVSSTALGAKFLKGPESAGNHTTPDIKYNPSTENDPSDEEHEFRSLAEIARANGFIFEDHWLQLQMGIF